MFPSLPYRQVHLDFHTSEHIPDVGKDFNKKDFQTALKKGNVDSITLFAKCHHGWCYYPTKVGKAHPHLVQPDLLGLQMEACREIGVATPAYVTVQWDEKAAREHPEWRVVRADNPAGGDVLKAQWHPLCLSNPGAVEQVIAHAEELIERYHPPGFFFDILLMWECVCPNCVAKMQADGRDAEVKADRIANHRDWVLNAFQRISAAVWKKDPQCRVYLNAGIAKGEPERWANFSHLELESLPTGGWGWDHFPLAARYAATQGKEYLGMSGKFHTTWGELGGYKTSTSLEFECASMVAQGARCSIGDQLHPSGRIDLPTYERLGPAYERVRKLEPYAKGARNVSDIAILSVEAVQAYHKLPGAWSQDGDAGAARVLLEAHVMFDIIDCLADFSPYKLLVLPDDVRLDAALAKHLKDFVAAGGSLILSGSSGMDVEAKRFLLDAGLAYDGLESPWNPDYLEAGKTLLDTSAGKRLVSSPFVVYERARQVRAAGAEVLATVREPYFNRTWDHFSSHLHSPARPEASKAYQGAFRQGRVVYFSHPLFTAYKNIGQPLLRDLVLAALELLLPLPRVTSGLPSSARLTLQRQDKEKRTLVHLTFAQPALRGSGVAFSGGTPLPLEMVEDTVPLLNVPVSLTLGVRPARVRAVLAGVDLPFDWKDGRASVVVPQMFISETLSFEEA